MLYRRVSENGDELSILGFGCMRLPVKEGKIDRVKAKYQIYYAIDHGVNYIDTAWIYHLGENELFLGSIFADGYREKIKLATKLPSWIVKSREEMDQILNTQLERLRTDHIDYYLVHSLIGTLWDRLVSFGVTDFLDSAKADGRITNAGFSFHGSIEDFKRIVDAYPWTFCQIQHNFLDRKNQAGIEGLKYAASKGLGITGCRYCLPCPSGVDIPGCFEIYDNVYLSGDEGEGKLMYAAKPGGIIRGGVPGYASQCVRCGKCLEKCPQHLDIPALLKIITEKFEGLDLEIWKNAAREKFRKDQEIKSHLNLEFPVINPKPL